MATMLRHKRRGKKTMCAPPFIENSAGDSGEPLVRSRLEAECSRRAIFATAEVPVLLDEVIAALARFDYGAKDAFAVRLALDEAVTNAVKHGHRHDPGKKTHVSWTVTTSAVKLVVEDEGPGFDPARVPDPSLPENQQRPCGRGLFLMRTYMSWVRFNGRGNRVVMCRYRSMAHAADNSAGGSCTC
jgi:serine/threonine-protein kinase RsbW